MKSINSHISRPKIIFKYHLEIFSINYYVISFIFANEINLHNLKIYAHDTMDVKFRNEYCPLRTIASETQLSQAWLKLLLVKKFRYFMLSSKCQLFTIKSFSLPFNIKTPSIIKIHRFDVETAYETRMSQTFFIPTKKHFLLYMNV